MTGLRNRFLKGIKTVRRRLKSSHGQKVLRLSLYNLLG